MPHFPQIQFNKIPCCLINITEELCKPPAPQRFCKKKKNFRIYTLLDENFSHFLHFVYQMPMLVTWIWLIPCCPHALWNVNTCLLRKEMGLYYRLRTLYYYFSFLCLIFFLSLYSLWRLYFLQFSVWLPLETFPWIVTCYLLPTWD